ncbi:TauD/TfdA family dioxygenase [Streptomyces rimosus]|uniref:TauD/TfdA dioxygenase family protein n=1 Tax=Streptomyces rimosus TaxID=1927 RepID=UPI000A7693A1|nr:TauD/TfdA family dioxygenase [Streptomyces rimosus]
MSDALGVQVSGVALQDCSSGELTDLLRLVEQAGLVVFRRQSLDDREMHSLARRIGPLEESSRKVCLSPDFPQISYLSNLRDESGDPIGFAGADTDYWHSDQQHRENPATLAVLYCVVPAVSGGATSFLPTEVGAMGLDERTVAELAARRAVYEPAFNHDNAPQIRVSHPALLVSPASGKRCAYVSDNTLEFTGLDAEQSRQLKATVVHRMIRPSRVYSHRWATGDFALYDNAQLLHRREEFRGRRWLKATKIFAPKDIFAVPAGEVVTGLPAGRSASRVMEVSGDVS